MKLYSSIFLGLILLLSQSKAQSPISLTSSNFPSNADTLRYSTTSTLTAINYTQTGTNFNWNFSNLIPNGQGVRNYKLGLLTPYGLFFTGLTEYGEKIADTLGAGPLTITKYYNFYKKQTTPVNAYVVDGAGMTFSNIPVPSYYTDKDELYMLPMTYPKYDSTTFKYATSSSTLLPIVYSKTGFRVTKVDGWGTITTPYGTAPCLRLVTTQYSQDSIKNTIFPLPIGFANNQRSYQWLTSNSKIPYLEINGNLIGNNFTITEIRYRDIYRTMTSIATNNEQDGQIKIYPNPVNKEIELDLTTENAKIEIFDMNGRLVYKEEVSGSKFNKNSINVELLPQGLYNLNVIVGSKSTNFKFIKR